MTNLTKVAPEPLLAMLDANWATVEAEYTHFGKFNLAEVTDFLAGKPGTPIKSSIMGFGRSHQVKQALSVIGARLVDKDLATPETRVVYKQLWATKCTAAACQYCHKPYKYDFMMGDNNGNCFKARCMMQYMRDNI